MMQLYQILNKYLPETESLDIDVLEYSQQILKKTIDAGKPEAFLQSLSLMAKVDLMDMIKMNSYERLELFMRCIVENRVWLIRTYLRRFGYGTSIG